MSNERTSRRRFLGALAAAASSASAPHVRAEDRPEPDPRKERLTRLAARYGSELGGIRRIGR